MSRYSTASSATTSTATIPTLSTQRSTMTIYPAPKASTPNTTNMQKSKLRPRLNPRELSSKISQFLSPALFPRSPNRQPVLPSLAHSRLPPPCAELDPAPKHRIRRFKKWRDQVPELRMALLDPKRRGHLIRYQTYTLPWSNANTFQRGVKRKVFPRGAEIQTYDAWPSLKALRARHELKFTNTSTASPSISLQKTNIPRPVLTGPQRKQERTRLKQHRWVLHAENERRWRQGMREFMASVVYFQDGCMLAGTKWRDGKGVWLPDFDVDEVINLTNLFRDIRRQPSKVFELSPTIEPVKGRKEADAAIKANEAERMGRKDERRQQRGTKAASTVQSGDISANPLPPISTPISTPAQSPSVAMSKTARPGTGIRRERKEESGSLRPPSTTLTPETSALLAKPRDKRSSTEGKSRTEDTSHLTPRSSSHTFHLARSKVPQDKVVAPSLQASSRHAKSTSRVALQHARSPATDSASTSPPSTAPRSPTLRTSQLASRALKGTQTPPPKPTISDAHQASLFRLLVQLSALHSTREGQSVDKERALAGQVTEVRAAGASPAPRQYRSGRSTERVGEATVSAQASPTATPRGDRKSHRGLPQLRISPTEGTSSVPSLASSASTLQTPRGIRPFSLNIDDDTEAIDDALVTPTTSVLSTGGTDSPDTSAWATSEKRNDDLNIAMIDAYLQAFSLDVEDAPTDDEVSIYLSSAANLPDTALSGSFDTRRPF